jgi:hypothetical protein
LGLLQHGRIQFPADLPKALPREEARDLKLDFIAADGEFIAAVKHKDLQSDYRISASSDIIPNDYERILPVYCPKLEPLIGVARDTFGGEAVTVLVLNTRRDPSSPESPDEPIASGPLTAKFLAERLSVSWTGRGGPVPIALEQNTSTWMDLLIGNEEVESPATQQEVAQRLSGAIRAWGGGSDRDLKIAVTTTGGLPPLKPIIERIPATCLGQTKVKLLEQPERGPPAATPINYESRVAEQETLRFYCAEALRSGDFIGAYGIASRYRVPWAQAVRNRLGPLLQLPYQGSSILPQGKKLMPHELYACQVETRLCGRDAAGATVQLHVFIESAIWDLFDDNVELIRLGLRPDRANESLRGVLSVGGMQELLRTDTRDPGRHTVYGIVSNDSWAKWLADTSHAECNDSCSQYCTAARSVQSICEMYNARPPGGISLRGFRNRLVHGGGAGVDLSNLTAVLGRSGLTNGYGAAFGQNFLAAAAVRKFLAIRADPDLGNLVRQQLASLLEQVICE